MTIVQLKKLATEVLRGAPKISHGKDGMSHEPNRYYVNVYGPNYTYDVRVTAKDKDTAVAAAAAALQVMRADNG